MSMSVYVNSLPIFVQVTLGFAYAGLMVSAAGGVVWLASKLGNKP
jgi:hypothetical protein